MTSKTILAFFAIFFTAFTLTSCHQKTLQDQAEEEAKDFTRRYCPTPIINNIRTDSVVFDRRDDTYTFYCTFCGFMDDEEIINRNKQAITEMQRKTITESPSMKTFIEAGFHFRYIFHSEKDSKKVLYQVTF